MAADWSEVDGTILGRRKADVLTIALNRLEGLNAGDALADVVA